MSSTRATRIFFAMLVATLASTDCLADTPLPPDVAIVTPSPDTPKDAAAFSGTWVGRWEDTLEHTLVVERVEGRNVSAIYSTGVAASWGIDRTSFVRTKGTVSADGSLHLSLPSGGQATYRPTSAPDELQGDYARGTIVHGRFKRRQ